MAAILMLDVAGGGVRLDAVYEGGYEPANAAHRAMADLIAYANRSMHPQGEPQVEGADDNTTVAAAAGLLAAKPAAEAARRLVLQGIAPHE